MGVNKPQTICWKCEKACGDCSWSDHWMHEPVKGWKAIKDRVRTNSGEYDVSYTVLKCPEFEPDRKGRKWTRKS